METNGFNLYIVDDNKVILTALKNHLQKQFGLGLNISTFTDGETCLRYVDKHTNAVILDYYMPGKNGLETLKSIKAISPKTEVIMLSNNQNVALVIETLRAGAKTYLMKGPTSWNKLVKLVTYLVTLPIHLIVREFKVTKFVAIFFLTFVTMAIVVICALNLMHSHLN